jgi:hypothetical protein
MLRDFFGMVLGIRKDFRSHADLRVVIYGTARILPKVEEAAPAQAFIRKYGLQKRLLDWLWRKTENIYIEIEPTQQSM